MTLVAGVIHNNRVYMAGDSFCGDEGATEQCMDPKVTVLHNSLVVGVCGSIRGELLVKQHLDQIQKSELSKEFILHDLPIHMFNLLGELDGESRYLLGFQGYLFYLESDMSTWEPARPYAAIGRGREMALGALAYAQDSGDLQRRNPLIVLEQVMQACTMHNPWIMPPYSFIQER